MLEAGGSGTASGKGGHLSLCGGDLEETGLKIRVAEVFSCHNEEFPVGSSSSF